MPVYYNPVLNSLNTPSVTQDLIANRPPAGIYGRWFHGTDDNILYWDDGTTWIAMTSGGSGVTGSGTPTRLAMWRGSPTNLTDSPLEYQLVAPGDDRVFSDYGLWIREGTNNRFVRLMVNGSISHTILQALDLALSSPNVYQVSALDVAGVYTQLVHLAQVGSFIIRNDNAGGKIRLQTNAGTIELIADDVNASGNMNVSNNMQAGEVISDDDVSATNDVIAGNNLLAHNIVRTGDPGGGSGDTKLGKVNVTAPPATNAFWKVEIDGVAVEIPVRV